MDTPPDYQLRHRRGNRPPMTPRQHHSLRWIPTRAGPRSGSCAHTWGTRGRGVRPARPLYRRFTPRCALCACLGNLRSGPVISLRILARTNRTASMSFLIAHPLLPRAIDRQQCRGGHAHPNAPDRHLHRQSGPQGTL